MKHVQDKSCYLDIRKVSCSFTSVNNNSNNNNMNNLVKRSYTQPMKLATNGLSNIAEHA